MFDRAIGQAWLGPRPSASFPQGGRRKRFAGATAWWRHLMLVTSRSRSKRAEATRQPSRVSIKRPRPKANVALRLAGMTLKAMREVMATVARLARTENCWAVRGSLDRADKEIPTRSTKPQVGG
jgi:hypothetical protein